jgi:hypothetical protein
VARGNRGITSFNEEQGLYILCVLLGEGQQSRPNLGQVGQQLKDHILHGERKESHSGWKRERGEGVQTKGLYILCVLLGSRDRTSGRLVSS